MVVKGIAAVMRKFVIVSTQRTGSTHLVKLLDSHPSILCAGEVFYPPSGSEYAIKKYINQTYSRKIKHQLYRSGLVEEFLDDFYNKDEYSAVGFKYMYSQARKIPRCYPSVLRYLLKNQISVIHGVRDNGLRVLVSRISSKSSGVYRSTVALKRPPVYVPSNSLIRNLNYLRQQDAIWEKKLSSLPYIKISYESIMKDGAAEERRLLRFLGAGYEGELTSPFKKLGASSLQSLIHNYDEVKNVLEGTEFECFLRDEAFCA